MHSKKFGPMFLPAFMERRHDGRYVVLNRHGSPLGHPPNSFGAKESDPTSFLLDARDRNRLGDIASYSEDDLRKVYLFTSSNNPFSHSKQMPEYLARLRRLAGLRISTR